MRNNHYYYTMIYSNCYLHLGCHSNNVFAVSEMKNYHYYTQNYLNWCPHLGCDYSHKILIVLEMRNYYYYTPNYSNLFLVIVVTKFLSLCQPNFFKSLP